MDKQQYDSVNDTKEHIKEVQWTLAVLRKALLGRMESHDASKLLSPEKEVFDEVTPRLKGLTYGSDEYKESLADMGKALEHHYGCNRHHPEHFGTLGIRGMTLVDVVEMFCDWCAATQRHADGDIFESIEHNAGRFGYGEDLKAIFINTAREYKLGRRNEE